LECEAESLVYVAEGLTDSNGQTCLSGGLGNSSTKEGKCDNSSFNHHLYF
jgi:hypothetical protein